MVVHSSISLRPLTSRLTYSTLRFSLYNTLCIYFATKFCTRAYLPPCTANSMAAARKRSMGRYGGGRKVRDQCAIISERLNLATALIVDNDAGLPYPHYRLLPAGTLLPAPHADRIPLYLSTVLDGSPPACLRGLTAQHLYHTQHSLLPKRISLFLRL